nr:hypothetical protein CFP56_67460 [Quercus suber]
MGQDEGRDGWVQIGGGGGVLRSVRGRDFWELMSRDGFGRGREAKRRDSFGREREVKSRLGLGGKGSCGVLRSAARCGKRRLGSDQRRWRNA